jgi:predicted Zn-dependent protease
MRLRALPALLAVAVMAIAPAAHAQRLAGAHPAVGSVEEGLWSQSERAERDAKTSGDIDRDEALNTYVRGVACKVASDYCNDLRIYVMDRPFFNAQMAPNGYTEVWSGSLLRAENEADLAFILSHEVSHFEQNHSLEAWERTKSTANAMMAVSVGLAVLGTAAAAGAGTYQQAQNIADLTKNLIDIVYLIGIANLFDFTRAQEAQADHLGIHRMARRLRAGGCG